LPFVFFLLLSFFFPRAQKKGTFLTFRRGGFLEDEDEDEEEVDAHALVQTLPKHEEAEEEKEVVVEEDMSAKTKARLLSRARAVTREA
jgi:hypothetical protein